MGRTFETILVTGGAGFIGSNFIHFLFEKAGFEGRIVNLDALTYAGNLESLADVAEKFGGNRYFFERADICDRAAVERIFATYAPDAVVHLAAESHVDRSILGPEAFIKTNIMGTFTLLDVARNAWKGRGDVLFHHISTDEVFGSLGDSGYFTEATPYDPRSPYSASKAGSDHLVMAYSHTYGLPVTLSNCSNNYGPYQFPEKLIPLMILNMVEGKASLCTATARISAIGSTWRTTTLRSGRSCSGAMRGGATLLAGRTNGRTSASSTASSRSSPRSRARTRAL